MYELRHVQLKKNSELCKFAQFQGYFYPKSFMKWSDSYILNIIDIHEFSLNTKSAHEKIPSK